MRCGKEADTAVAMCIDIITHSAEVAKNQLNNIVVVVSGGTYGRVKIRGRWRMTTTLATPVVRGR